MILEKIFLISITLIITFFGLYVLKMTYITVTSPINFVLKVVPCLMTIAMWICVIRTWINIYKVFING